MTTEGAAEGDVSAPKWIRELEEKRERRLKARLGHEAGAGSPCLVCEDKCPGLDLHFWRKICKNCRCGKENHDVQDDDLHGWVQFQLLGSKPKKPQKIVLPGKKDEIELEWAPKGSQEAVETYLKDLPAELLPIKGSSAAQERKQLLQKQIPIHDVDPTLCHALTEEETQQMNDYINHVKENSVGVGLLTRISVPAKLVSSKPPGLVMTAEGTNLKQANICKNLQNLTLNTFRPISQDDPIYANYPQNKHDYENIDEFGKHKLEASLEEIERLQQVTSGEVLDGFGNPVNAQYAMLLDKNSLPIKDKLGAPIKASLDLYGNPVFDVGVVDKIGQCRAEFAILLDKNGVPILDEQGNTIKNPIVYHPAPYEGVVDKFGNKLQPQFALLLDKNYAPIKDKYGSPIRVNVDAFGGPIIERGLGELVNTLQPQYAYYLDKNGAPVVDKFGTPVKFNLNNLNNCVEDVLQKPAMYALLLDKNRAPIMGKFGKPITTNLDPYGAPILDGVVVEKLHGITPQYAMMLDNTGAPILDKFKQPIQHSLNVIKEPLLDKFGNEIRSQLGVLLDKNESPIKDAYVGLDTFGRPVIDEGVVEKIGATQRPEFVMFLDRNCAPILDKYGSPIKNVVASYKDASLPQYGLLLDKNEMALKDLQGGPIKVKLDGLGKPIIDSSVLERVGNQKGKYVKLLDGTGVVLDSPIDGASYGLLLDRNELPLKDNNGVTITVNLDAFGGPDITKSVIEKIGNQKPEYVMLLDESGKPILDNYGNPVKKPMLAPTIRPVFGLLLDNNETPIRDNNGSPIRVYLDTFTRPIFDQAVIEKLEGRLPEFVTFLDRNGGVILDKYGAPIKEPITNPPIEELVDKYGDPIDINNATLLDNTGRPIVNQFGTPVSTIVDQFGRPMLQDTIQPVVDKNGKLWDLNNATLLGKQGLPILDNAGQPVQLKSGADGGVVLHKTGTPILDAAGTKLLQPPDDYLRMRAPVLDKYGNQIDPTTGRPMPSYHPVPHGTAMENTVNPTAVNVGAINDITYNPTLQPPNPPAESPPVFEPPDNYDPIPECHKCKKIFEDNAVVIQIDRSEALWHAACFKCAGCNQSLADMVYFYHKETDDIYCGRDFAKIRGIPRCNACDELIFVQEYCLAENETYHVKHFCCFECDEPLAGRNYVIENSQPFCISCFENLKADKCRACENIIKPDEQGANLNGTHFHTGDACFCCKTCKKPLLGGKFLFRNTTLYCSGACYTKDQ